MVQDILGIKGKSKGPSKGGLLLEAQALSLFFSLGRKKVVQWPSPRRPTSLGEVQLSRRLLAERFRASQKGFSLDVFSRK